MHKGMSSTNAFKNGKICVIHHGLSRHIYDFVAYEFIAKILYPNLFKDIDPLRDFIEFHNKFLPVNYSGIWFLCINKTILREYIKKLKVVHS